MKCTAQSSLTIDRAPRHGRTWPRWPAALGSLAVLALLAGALGCSQAEQPAAKEELLPPPTKVLYNPPYPNDEVEPFKVIDNIYFIGLTNYAAYLISTSDGLIMLDTMIEDTVPQQVAHIKKLGFKVEDIKILLQAHAHVDHVGGLAKFKEMSGGQVVVMAEDADVLADGGVSDYRGNGKQIWTPVKADRIIHDGDTVTLGDTTMTAHLTPAHSKGCTTWTTTAQEGGQTYNVVFFCSQRVNSKIPMVNNPKYPNLAEAFQAGFDTLKTLPCDVFLASHSFMFDLEGKLAKKAENPDVNPFIDPQGCKDYVKDWEYEFHYKLQQARLGELPQ